MGCGGGTTDKGETAADSNQTFGPQGRVLKRLLKLQLKVFRCDFFKFGAAKRGVRQVFAPSLIRNLAAMFTPLR